MEELKEITLNHTKISEELYDKKKKDDWWITANEAIELGIADEITERFV
jgi:ATP-dependent protease ClpP protease subunit